jgi:hypothetical protein
VTVDHTVIHKLVTVAASQTDSVVVAANPNARIRVLSIWCLSASTSTYVFNSKGSGAGTAITPTVTGSANLTLAVSGADTPLFSTNLGEGLALTTGAGGNTTVLVSYVMT